MATTIPEPVVADRKPSNGVGNGGWRNLTPADGDMRAVADRSPEPAKTGVWVGLAAITMSFAAFTSALVVRESTGNDWHHYNLPSILYFNTLILFLSSGTFELSRRSYRNFQLAAAERTLSVRRWMHATVALGLLFVAGQYVAWLQLKAQGVYLATNPSSSFFYVLTAAHALHVLGGLGGLLYVVGKFQRNVLRRSSLDSAGYYWHFMDVLWVYLLAILWLKF